LLFVLFFLFAFILTGSMFSTGSPCSIDSAFSLGFGRCRLNRFAIDSIPVIRPPLGYSTKPCFQMLLNIRSVNIQFSQTETIDRPLNFPICIDPRRMIIAMLSTIDRESRPQNTVVEFLEMMSQFPPTCLRGRFGGRKRTAVDERMFAQRTPFRGGP